MKGEATTKLEERFKISKLFLSMCFLGTQNSIYMEQEDLFTDICINLKKRRSVVEEVASEEPKKATSSSKSTNDDPLAGLEDLVGDLEEKSPATGAGMSRM